MTREQGASLVNISEIITISRAGRAGTRGRAGRRAGRPAILGALAGLAALGMTAGLAPGAAPPASASQQPVMKAACRAARPGHERCLTLYAPQAAVNRAIAAGIAGPPAAPAGWGATDIEAAYRLPASRTSGQTVAVSIAYDTPRLEQYLNVYRTRYGLPRCTAASGCFRKVNQAGNATPLPPSGVGSGWDVEAALDVSMISAACPACRILVVEARSNSDKDMAATEDAAARLGAQVISNSYGQRENGAAMAYARAYDHPGHMIVVSSGDFGFTAAMFPAALGNVTAVGGTQLTKASNPRGWTEQVWNDPAGASGSGCSAYVAKPAWQHDAHCRMRAIADVSAVAANIPIYNADYGGWLTVEGTSASAPLIAGIYGLAGNAVTITPGNPYRHASALFDVTAGGNDWFNAAGGATCDHDYLCTAAKGYDAPTGLGTPNGTGAF
jgi:hypothetical protein